MTSIGTRCSSASRATALCVEAGRPKKSTNDAPIAQLHIAAPIARVQPPRRVDDVDEQMTEMVVHTAHQAIALGIGPAAGERLPQIVVGDEAVPAVHAVEQPGQSGGDG